MLAVTSLTRSGLRDWLIQRVSAVVLASYILCVLGFFVCHRHVTYDLWNAFFSGTTFQVFTVLALLNLILHAWIGMWTVATDYLKCSCLRLTFHVVVALTLLSCLIWGIFIIWGL